MKSLIPTGQDYIGSGAWYQFQNTKSTELNFSALLGNDGARDALFDLTFRT
jgi:hypothetical protein